MQDVHGTTVYVSALNSSCARKHLLLVGPIIPSGSSVIKQDLIVHRMNPLRVLDISVVTSYWVKEAQDFKIAKYGCPAHIANLRHWAKVSTSVPVRCFGLEPQGHYGPLFTHHQRLTQMLPSLYAWNQGWMFLNHKNTPVIYELPGGPCGQGGCTGHLISAWRAQTRDSR